MYKNVWNYYNAVIRIVKCLFFARPSCQSFKINNLFEKKNVHASIEIEIQQNK